METLWCAIGTSLCMKSEVWAAWWQGIGTVAALFVAVGIAAHQRREDRKHRNQEEASARRMVELFSARLLTCVQDYAVTCENMKVAGGMSPRLRSDLQRIKAVLKTLAYWPDAVDTDRLDRQAILIFLHLQSMLAQVRAEIELLSF